MIEQIEKLRQEREVLTTEHNANQKEYKGEIKRIDRAIKHFEKGMNVLQGTIRPKGIKKYSEIERVLAETGPLHVKQLCKKLHERGIPMKYASASGLLQFYAKSGKMFVKTAPATYGLLDSEILVTGTKQQAKTQ